MEEITIEPVLAYPSLGPRLTIKDVSRDIAAAGIPLETARARASGFAKLRLIHVREAGRHTAPNIYEFSDSAAAVVLSALQDSGVADNEVMGSASSALYGWSPAAAERDAKYIATGSTYLPRHPIDRAVVGILRGESWCFAVNVWRDPQTETRIIDADLYALTDPFIGHRMVPPTATPRASIVVTLDEMLLPVARRLLPDTRN